MSNTNCLERSRLPAFNLQMKKIKIATISILANFMLLMPDNSMADTVMLAVGDGLPATQTYQVSSNVTAQIIPTVYTKNNYSSAVYVSLPQATYPLSIGTSGILIVGPATVSLTDTNGVNTLLSLCTIQTSSASPASFTPSSSVVIPNDNGGPVTIILESSTDLINWTAANPGAYGTTSSNRFFRVRAQR
jgi:hypothetical protein